MDEFLSRQRLLVIAPHADDETFGCGGTIAKIKGLGGEVFVMVLSVGDLVHYQAEAPVTISGETRVEEFEKAMKFLKVDDYEVVFTDPEMHLRLDAIPRRDLIAKIEREGNLAIDKIKPSMLVLPTPSYNQDHEAVFRAGFAACRPHLLSIKHFVKIVLASDAPQLCWNPEAFRPNFYVDISDYLEIKLKAHAFHQSQRRPPPHHASLENLERLARARGAEIGVEAAEAFFCYRFVI